MCSDEIIYTAEVDHGGRTLQVVVVMDHDASPDGADCYTADDVAAWRRDEWRYVGVMIKDGGQLIDSLWGVEWGSIAGREIGMAEIMSVHPVPDMLTDIK